MTGVAFGLLSVWAAWSVLIITRVLLAGRDDRCDCRTCENPVTTYDPTLTRTRPNEHCRYAVVDNPTTRCPSCWTQLPEATS